MGGKVPSTVSDKEWRRVKQAVQKEIPSLVDPWTDPKLRAKKEHFEGASKKAGSN